jgi:hypothetical protein
MLVKKKKQRLEFLNMSIIKLERAGQGHYGEKWAQMTKEEKETYLKFAGGGEEDAIRKTVSFVNVSSSVATVEDKKDKIEEHVDALEAVFSYVKEHSPSFHPQPGMATDVFVEKANVFVACVILPKQLQQDLDKQQFRVLLPSTSRELLGWNSTIFPNHQVPTTITVPINHLAPQGCFNGHPVLNALLAKLK